MALIISTQVGRYSAAENRGKPSAFIAAFKRITGQTPSTYLPLDGVSATLATPDE